MRRWINIKAREIRSGVYWVGAIDCDWHLSDELIPLPDGTSYNSYLIQGSEKTALIDTVDPAMEHMLTSRLDDLAVKQIDYFVANCAEQDHSGSIPAVLAKYPMAKVICSPRCKGLLTDLLHVPEDMMATVSDRESLSLGDRTLEFILAVWVHWPETMLICLREARILFPYDLFGSHLATSDLYVTDEGRVFESAKRYYAEIMMPFHTNIEKHLERLKGCKIELIAPSHGPVYTRLEFIIEAYRKWVFDIPEDIVILRYISLQGNTRRMVEYFVEALANRGVTVKQFDLATVDIGKLAMALVDAATLVVGVSTTPIGPHPNVAYAFFLANALRPKTRFASITGLYGCGSQAKEQIINIISNLKAELLESVIAKGLPKGEDFKALDALASTIAQKHKSFSDAAA